MLFGQVACPGGRMWLGCDDGAGGKHPTDDEDRYERERPRPPGGGRVISQQHRDSSYDAV